MRCEEAPRPRGRAARLGVWVVGLAIVWAGAVGAPSADGQGKRKLPPGPAKKVAPTAAAPTIEPDVQAAWEKAGGKLFWVGPWDHSAIFWSAKADELRDPVPGFFFNLADRVSFAALPDSQEPFGIASGQAHYTPQQVKAMRHLKHLVYFDLRMAVQYPTCPGLGDLTALRGLNASLYNGSDEFVRAEVVRLKNLRHLGLTGGKYTDKAFALIGAMKPLETVSVQLLPLSDKGVQHLARLPNLKSLTLFYEPLDRKGVKVGRDGIKAVGKLNGLEYLSLEGVGLTDADLGVLAGLENLKSLQLHHEKLSDAGLEKLHALTDLKTLSVRNSQVSPAALTALRKAIPGVQIQGPR